MSTRTAAKGQFKGAMERFIYGFKWHRHSRGPAKQGARSENSVGNGTLHAWVRFGAKLTKSCHTTPPTVSISLGRWRKVQGMLKRQTLQWGDGSAADTRHADPIQWGDGTLHMGSIRRNSKAHPLPQCSKQRSAFQWGAMDEMSGQKVQQANTLHRRCRSSCNVQPNQLGRPTRLYQKDPAPTVTGVAIEHHTSGHLRLDGHSAVDADRRITDAVTTVTSAHIGG